jgi:DNA polymerase-3 subunit alpha
MAAVLSADMDSTDKVVNFLAESRNMGLEVAAPDVNASGYRFEALAGTSLRYGLGAVKGVGHGAVDSIVAAREARGRFADLADFCRRVDPHKLNKRVLEALILSGSMDSLGCNRATLMAQLPDASRAAEQQARNAELGQNDMFGSVPVAPRPEAVAAVDPWPLERILAGERATLGHYLSGHPTDAWRELIARVATCPIGDIDQHLKPASGEFRGRRHEQPFTLVGLVVTVRKRGDSMAFVQVEDASGRLEVSLYREAWVEYGPLLTPDAILVFEGGLSGDDFTGGFQLRAHRVSTIEEACAREARLLHIEVDGASASFTGALERVLATHRGGHTPVRIALRNGCGGADIELGEAWRVRASPAVVDAVRSLDGVGAARLVYGRLNARP